MMKAVRFLAGFVVAALLPAPPPAQAWSREGHAIIAEIAWDHTLPDVRKNLAQLLGDRPLDAIAGWPDEIRSALPETTPWHYVNIPSTAEGYLAGRDCPDGDCVVEKIRWFSQILGDAHQTRAARLLALEFLVHLTGDIHQPFHAIADARGGNDIPVTYLGAPQCGGSPCNLHRIWDEELLAHARLGEQQYTAYLEKQIAENRPDPGAEDPEQWANASWMLAKEAIVPPGANLGETYSAAERPVVERQLALAGLRLARLLNEDLGSSRAAAPSAAVPSPIVAFAPAANKPPA